MTAFLHFAKQALDDIGSADKLPMLLRKAVEGQTVLEIALERLNSAWVDFLVLGHKGSQLLIGFFTAGLVKDGFEFRSYLVMLFLRNIAQYILHLNVSSG